MTPSVFLYLCFQYCVCVCLCQRFCRAGGSSLTVQSLPCCCSLWASKQRPVRYYSVTSDLCFTLPFVNLQRTSRLSVSFSFPGVEMESYNLLVTSTIEMAVVYRSETDEWFCAVLLSLWRRRNCKFFLLHVFYCRDVQKHGLSQATCLLESDQWDAVVCALVIDLDFDGQKEVLLGTYGQVRASFTNG